MPLDGNAEGILEERILPGVHVRFFGGKGDVGAFREGRGFGNRYGFGGAGLDAFAREAVGRRESPGAAGDDADADAEGFGFDERADFAVFCADFALADVHDARVGIGGATAFGRFDGPGSPVLHHAREAETAEFSIFLERGELRRSVHLCRIENMTVTDFERVTGTVDASEDLFVSNRKSVVCFEGVTATSAFLKRSFVSNRNSAVAATGESEFGVPSAS